MIAAIYARKSTEQSGVADEAKSVTRQIDHARTYAQHKAWTVSDQHVYGDDGLSGAEFLKRPGFLRLMNAETLRTVPRWLLPRCVAAFAQRQAISAASGNNMSGAFSGTTA